MNINSRLAAITTAIATSFVVAAFAVPVIGSAPDAKFVAASDVTIGVGSFNTCNTQCAKPDTHGMKLPAFNVRAPHIAEQILDTGVGLVGLQETNKENTTELLKYLGPDWAAGESVQNNSIIFNSTVLSADDENGNELAHGEVRTAYNLQKRVMPYQTLRIKATGVRIAFADVHAYVGDDFLAHRAEQLERVVKRATEFASAQSTIIVGDMNTRYIDYEPTTVPLKVPE